MKLSENKIQELTDITNMVDSNKLIPTSFKYDIVMYKIYNETTEKEVKRQKLKELFLEFKNRMSKILELYDDHLSILDVDDVCLNIMKQEYKYNPFLLFLSCFSSHSFQLIYYILHEIFDIHQINLENNIKINQEIFIQYCNHSIDLIEMVNKTNIFLIDVLPELKTQKTDSEKYSQLYIDIIDKVKSYTIEFPEILNTKLDIHFNTYLSVCLIMSMVEYLNL